MRFSVRQLMAINVGIAGALIWLIYLFDRATAYQIEGKFWAAVAVVLGLPALILWLAMTFLGPGRRRGRAIRASLGLHAALMTLLCSSPLLLMAYDRFAHPGKLSPHRMIFLGMATVPSAAMTLVYAIGFLLIASSSITRGWRASLARKGGGVGPGTMPDPSRTRSAEPVPSPDRIPGDIRRARPAFFRRCLRLPA